MEGYLRCMMVADLAIEAQVMEHSKETSRLGRTVVYCQGVTMTHVFAHTPIAIPLSPI